MMDVITTQAATSIDTKALDWFFVATIALAAIATFASLALWRYLKQLRDEEEDATIWKLMAMWYQTVAIAMVALAIVLALVQQHGVAGVSTKGDWNTWPWSTVVFVVFGRLFCLNFVLY